MDIVRKIGTGIVFIIPTFVFSGLVYDLFHSYILAIGMVIVPALIYISIIAGWPLKIGQQE